MERKSSESTRYGIGEWYGKRIGTISSSQRLKYAKIRGINKELCPHGPRKTMCNKNGGVCSLATYRKEEDDKVIVDSSNPNLHIMPEALLARLYHFQGSGADDSEDDKTSTDQGNRFSAKYR